ncbi:hypothetical protein HYS93_00445 [Candidatus Daviesbacteria bacterium]|nr:hypothetical protein [Candidatus Daviesbacteria bacterium]
MSDDDQPNQITSSTQLLEEAQGGDVALPQSPVNRIVDIKIVRGIAEHDFGQTQVTLEAYNKAGMNPQDIAHGLNRGHGYQIERVQTVQAFYPDQKIAGMQASENLAMGYQINQAEKVSAEEVELKLEPPSGLNNNSLVFQSKALETVIVEEVVDMVVGVKQQSEKIDSTQETKSLPKDQNNS